MSCTSIPIGTIYSTPALVETIAETTITVYTSPGTTITVPYTTTECSSLSPSVTSDPITSNPITSDPITSDPITSNPVTTTSSRVTTSDEPVITDSPTTEGGRSSEAVTTSDEVRTTDAPTPSDGPETADEPTTSDSGADDGSNADGGPTEDGGNNSVEPTEGAARRRRHRYPRQLQCTTFVTSSISTVESQLITSPLVIQELTTRFGDPVAVGTQYSVTCAPEPGQTITAVVTVTDATTAEPEPTTVTQRQPTMTVVATVVSVSNLVSTLLIPSTLWPTSSSIANSTQTTPATAPRRSSNVGMIAGAIAAAVVVLAVVIGVIFYFKCFRKDSGGRGSHIVDLGAPPAGGIGLSSAAFVPDKARILHPFTLGGGGTPYLTANGEGAGSSSSAGGGGAFVPQEKGSITAARNATPFTGAGGAKRRESDSSQPILPALLRNPTQQHSRRNTDPLVSSSSSQRHSSLEGTMLTDPTYTTAPSSEKASVYVDPRMSGMPLPAGTPSNEGSSHRDSVTSYLLSSPGHKRGRPLPSIPDKASSSSPPPDPSTAISALDRASTLGRSTHRPFSPESRPRSPELPPPSYDEAERIRRRESIANNNWRQ